MRNVALSALVTILALPACGDDKGAGGYGGGAGTGGAGSSGTAGSAGSAGGAGSAGSAGSAGAAGRAGAGGSAGTGGNGGGGTGGAGSGGSGVDPSLLGEALPLEIEQFTARAGSERQVCKYVNLNNPAPLEIVKFSAHMVGKSHHFNVYKMLTARPDGNTTVQDCPPAGDQISGRAAYIFGSGQADYERLMPAGVGFKLEANAQILLEMHVINATQSEMPASAHFEMTKPSATNRIQHHADMMWLFKAGIYLPPGMETSGSAHCEVPYPVKVFGMLTHTHSLGTHTSVETKKGQAVEHLYDSYDWQHPPYQTWDTPFDLEMGQGFQWTCTWNNTTTHNVTFGQSSTDEMCILFVAAYPRDTLDMPPIQCNVI